MTDRAGTVALLWGAGSTLGRAVAFEMTRHGVRVALHDDMAAGRLPEIRDAVQAAGGEVDILTSAANGSLAVAHQAIERFGRLDYLINLYLPNPEIETAEQVAAYPARLLERCRIVGAAIAQLARGGAIVNHAALPSTYAGTGLADGMPLLRAAITGVTRSACLLLAPAGVRVNYIQTGLLDLPETRAFARDGVLRLEVPIGRWSTAEEFAKLAALISLRATYMTGQGVILDGGLTAGLTGN
ncbi:MAG TPA: SDR family oxidoreductase [Myxococcaceae bacterium]|nr:SDR family oxidoreductase [Myxococcaceae bacterium]